MFMDGVNRVDLRDGEAGSGPLQRAFSASATCLERPFDSQVSCFVFCQHFFFSKMELEFDVQFDQREMRKSKSAEVHLFDIEPPSISSSLERDKVIRFGTI